MFITVLLVFMSTFVLLFAVYQISGIRDLYKKTAHIHGPMCFPLIGSALTLLGSPEHVLKQVLKFAKNYTSPFRLPLGSRVFVVTTNPEQIKTIFYSNKTAEKDDIYKIVAVIGGNGLFTAENKIWRGHRKILQPTFAPKIIESFFSIFQKNSLLLTEAVKGQNCGPEFDLSPHISQSFFSNICETSMGISFVTERKKSEECMHRTQRAFELFFERFIRVWLHVETLFNLSQIGKETYECRNYCYNFTEKVIDKRKKLLQNNHFETKENFEKKTYNTSLDLMLGFEDVESKFTDQEIRDHVITLIVAGYDTTARTYNFVLLMLASHPDIQVKVYEEIFNIYGDSDPKKNPVKYEDLQHLRYLERVIKETMRIFPVSPILFRRASDDFDIGGSMVPKDSGLAVFILGLHRDEKIWPQPLKFDPDRFLPEAVNKRHPCSFIPFSFGPRDCFGRTYAMMALKVFVATFLRKYIVIKDKISLMEDIRIKVDLLLKTVEPITLRIENRRK